MWSWWHFTGFMYLWCKSNNIYSGNVLYWYGPNIMDSADLRVTIHTDTIFSLYARSVPCKHSTSVMLLPNDILRNGNLKMSQSWIWHAVPCILRSPLWHCPPRSVLIGQDVEDLLFQLVSSHMISVLSGTDEVIAHFLLLSPVRSVLSTVRLQKSGG